jgi:CBS domain containing-hemolysin-like protein
MLLMLVYGVIALGISALCSLLEASLLSIPMSHVEMLVERGSRTGKRLQKMKASVDRPLAAILTLNTVAHTAGAAGVGVEAAELFGTVWVGAASAVMTVLILVLSEIVPKTLGAVYAKRLGWFTAMATRLLIFLTYPAVIVLDWINRLLRPKSGIDAPSRGELLAIARLGHEGGAMSSREFQVVRNMMSLAHITVSEILTPRTVLVSMNENVSVDEAMKGDQLMRFARIPIYRDSIDDVTGYVARVDVVGACRGGSDTRPLKELARPIKTVPDTASVAAALNTMLQEHEHILLVVDEYGGLDGVVTLEDVIETLLGTEIVDESDQTADLQELARRLAERRKKARSERRARAKQPES